jgi:hypothetical protein
MIGKNLQKKLADALKKFQKSRYEEVSQMMKELDAVRPELDKSSLSELLKFQSLFFWDICWVTRHCTRFW